MNKNIHVFPTGNTKRGESCREIFLREDPMFTEGEPGLDGQGWTLLVAFPLSASIMAWVIYLTAMAFAPYVSAWM